LIRCIAARPRDDLVPADGDDDVAGAEDDGGDPIADHVEIDQLARFGQGVAPGEEHIDQQGLAPPLDDLLARYTGFEGPG